MKKLNRKGFTLVELLAVIVILAIVIGITIPAITSTINSSKNSSLKSVLDNAENWITQQYALYNTNNSDDTVSDAFKDSITNIEATDGYVINNTGSASDNVIIASGISAKNFTTARVYLNQDTGRVCVIMTSIPESSQYFNTKIWTVAEDKTVSPKTNTDNTYVGADYIFSKSCAQTTDITKANA